MIHRGIFTPERLAAVETAPALLKQQGVKAHALIPESGNQRTVRFSLTLRGAVAVKLEQCIMFIEDVET